MTSKAERARELAEQGLGPLEISRRLKLSVTNVRKSLKRKNPDETREEKKARAKAEAQAKRYARYTRGLPKHTHTHQFVQPFERTPKPQGYCMAWTVENGKAQRCGKLCKRQLCDEHAHTTAPAISPLGRRDYL